jgi:hypothetical protein
LSSIDQANNLISCAKKLRLASDKAVRSGVYINRFMTKAESQAAYDLRCKRRSTVHTIAAAGPSGSSALSNYPPVESNNQSGNKNVLISNAITEQTSSSSSSATTSTTTPTPTQQVPVANTSMLNPNAMDFSHCYAVNSAAPSFVPSTGQLQQVIVQHADLTTPGPSSQPSDSSHSSAPDRH